VRSVTHRTLGLIEVAEKAYPMMKDKSKTADEKLACISTMVQEAEGCGETWAKMLTVCIDLAYPKEMLLETQCDVGTGASPALRCLLPAKLNVPDKKQALKELLKIVNSAKSPHSKSFWATLKVEEALISKHFKAFPLIVSQANTKERGMSAVTLQVQLCEYRQFRHSIARHKYGLPEDPNMRGEAEKSTRLTPDNFVEYDEKRKSVVFQFPKEDTKIDFEVPIKSTGNKIVVAFSVAHKCFYRLLQGESKQEVLKYRDELVGSYRGGVESPDESEAWEVCRAHGMHGTSVCSFSMEAKDGKKFPFQTTALAAGGVLEAERIARLCWDKLKAGVKKEAVIEFRNRLYKESAASTAATPQKRKAAASESPASKDKVKNAAATAKGISGPPAKKSKSL